MARSGDTPVWLLDVDGVLNAVPDTGNRGWPRGDWTEAGVTANGMTWHVSIANRVLAFVRHAHGSGQVEVRWHTTWQTGALDLAKVFDLPEFPIHPCPEFERDYFTNHRYLSSNRILASSSWWKYPAALRVTQAEGRSLIWTDDDVRDELTSPQRAALNRTGRRVLIIAPVPHRGLIQPHLNAIATFIGLDQAELTEAA